VHDMRSPRISERSEFPLKLRLVLATLPRGHENLVQALESYGGSDLL